MRALLTSQDQTPAIVQLFESSSCWLRVAHPTKVNARLKSAIPKAWSDNPRTLGEHLRRRRLQQGLMQVQVAAAMSVSEWTYLSWENDQKRPVITSWPKVIQFLGYDPVGEPLTDDQRIEAFRRRTGWTYARLATVLALDSETVTKWAQGKWRPRIKSESYERLLGLISAVMSKGTPNQAR